jgi:hypothetical protein
MIFAVNDDSGDQLEIIEHINTPFKDSYGMKQTYKFDKVKIVSEDEMYREFRHAIAAKVSKYHSCNITMDDDGVVVKRKGPDISSLKVNHFTGAYLVPKVYNYFPFLDCDSKDICDDVIFDLGVDNIPYIVYESSSDEHYWVFCDHAGIFDDTLSFIKQYTSDQRYAWIAEEKREFCVRAIPKNGYIPKQIDSHLDDEFTDEFKFFIKSFDDYWVNGKIIQYIDMISTSELI